MTIPCWRARINHRNREKPIEFGKGDREMLINYLLGTFKHGQAIEFFVRKVTRIRSMPQNKYYWGVVIPYICEETGMDKDQVHYALREKFLSKRDINTSLLIVKSTTELTIEQFRWYIDSIQRWAAEFLHINIPDPNQSLDFSDNVRMGP